MELEGVPMEVEDESNGQRGQAILSKKKRKRTDGSGIEFSKKPKVENSPRHSPKSKKISKQEVDLAGPGAGFSREEVSTTLLAAAVVPLKSKRPDRKDGEEVDNHVWRKYQKKIAKKLSRHLDEVLEDIVVEPVQQNFGPQEDCGIFLFSHSQTRLTAADIVEVVPKPPTKPTLRIKRHLDGSESEDEDKKLRAVAVCAEWVKNQNTF